MLALIVDYVHTIHITTYMLWQHKDYLLEYQCFSSSVCPSLSVFRLVRFYHVMMCNLRAAVSACVTSLAVRLTLYYLLLCSDVFLSELNK